MIQEFCYDYCFFANDLVPGQFQRPLVIVARQKMAFLCRVVTVIQCLETGFGIVFAHH